MHPEGGRCPSHASSKSTKSARRPPRLRIAGPGDSARGQGRPGLARAWRVMPNPTQTAQHVRLSPTRAFARGGQTSAESYLVFEKLLDGGREIPAPTANFHPFFFFC